VGVAQIQAGLHQGPAVATCGPDERNSSLSAIRPAARRTNLVAVNSTRRAVHAEERAWVSKALCKDKDPDELFVRGAKQRKAATICRHCPVMRECAADALDNQVEYGIWGGMTERQRRGLLKDHPEVVSWADYFNNRNSGFAAPSRA
jgi:WhiB family redox-sensing transcriptional regulator